MHCVSAAALDRQGGFLRRRRVQEEDRRGHGGSELPEPHCQSAVVQREPGGRLRPQTLHVQAL